MKKSQETRYVRLPIGEQVPAFGMGTWYKGDDPGARAEEIATLRLGLDLGARLIDTAEMNGGGRAEELVGEAIADRRDEVFLVSTVLPSNASRQGTVKVCEDSLRRLTEAFHRAAKWEFRGRFPKEGGVRLKYA